MERKIGVYVCHCGTNIAGTVDIEKVVRFCQNLPNVVIARDYKYMCSDPGQALIKEDIKNLGLNRVVVAACSPRMHEITFRRACREAGLNPYLFEMANIREHCSWVHDNGATEKAMALINAAVRKVYYYEPLEVKEVPINPNTLVVGGGIAGIQAALEIADGGYKVYLVEREPSIGGHMIQLDKTFPTLDCSACILTPKMSAVGTHPFIELMSYSEVIEVSGFVGNFKVKIKKKPRYVDIKKCLGCGICWEKCPEKVPSEFDMKLGMRKAIYIPFPQAVPPKPVIDIANCRYTKYLEFIKSKKEGRKPPECRICEKLCPTGAINWEDKEEIVEIEVGNIIVATGYAPFDPTPLKQYGYGRLDNVITALEFERMINASGPTGGKIVLKNGAEPKSVAIIHCVGSRDTNYHEYCSRVCCMYSMKFAHIVKERLHDAVVYEFYIDIRSAGKGFEEFYNRVLREGTIFIRGRPGEIVSQNGKLVIHFEDTLVGCKRQLPVDMVILSTAIEPQRDAEEVAKIFRLSRSADGFFLERHPKLDPVATPSDGIYVVGCCQGPKDIPDTVAQASAAAARVLALISKGKVEIEAITAVVDEEQCSGCRICNTLCFYNAITFDAEKRVSRINEVLCRGCGVCAAACPSGAIIPKHFTTEQIMAQIEGVLSV